ncbi:aspartyl-phosphate phosphatase Spo0E family protein [Metabacillus sp. B2-18]|uniref:aspartyl-phosphate phosphatase Spo0E family protein n=1 Tax=Metabacillus sp. B2-18 TaxID=2897333 RepID=UPI001E32D227|nr:aspartyl-phosphate phosphatase Spo0E family protein [Metabacillus sp. B2-18]UGB28800.1 aspartyl-phosphate phosphatase Spo0E family protein [Metabacillus sp. B2-18]
MKLPLIYKQIPPSNDLLIKINSLRSELIEIGLLIGLNHPITISLSQKLDNLITEYQKNQISRE